MDHCCWNITHIPSNIGRIGPSAHRWICAYGASLGSINSRSRWCDCGPRRTTPNGWFESTWKSKTSSMLYPLQHRLHWQLSCRRRAGRFWFPSRPNQSLKDLRRGPQSHQWYWEFMEPGQVTDAPLQRHPKTALSSLSQEMRMALQLSAYSQPLEGFEWMGKTMNTSSLSMSA